MPNQQPLMHTFCLGREHPSFSAGPSWAHLAVDAARLPPLFRREHLGQTRFKFRSRTLDLNDSPLLHCFSSKAVPHHSSPSSSQGTSLRVPLFFKFLPGAVKRPPPLLQLYLVLLDNGGELWSCRLTVHFRPGHPRPEVSDLVPLQHNISTVTFLWRGTAT